MVCKIHCFLSAEVSHQYQPQAEPSVSFSSEKPLPMSTTDQFFQQYTPLTSTTTSSSSLQAIPTFLKMLPLPFTHLHSLLVSPTVVRTPYFLLCLVLLSHQFLRHLFLIFHPILILQTLGFPNICLFTLHSFRISPSYLSG